MTNIGIILSDNSPHRNSVGLALEIEERINQQINYAAQFIDLQDFKNYLLGLGIVHKFDANILLVHDEKGKVPSCVNSLLDVTFPEFSNVPFALVVNTSDPKSGDAVWAAAKNLLWQNEALVFEKKYLFHKIQDRFNSSYQVIDENFGEQVKELVKEYLEFIEEEFSGSSNKVLSETL